MKRTSVCLLHGLRIDFQTDSSLKGGETLLASQPLARTFFKIPLIFLRAARTGKNPTLVALIHRLARFSARRESKERGTCNPRRLAQALFLDAARSVCKQRHQWSLRHIKIDDLHKGMYPFSGFSSASNHSWQAKPPFFSGARSASAAASHRRRRAAPSTFHRAHSRALTRISGAASSARRTGSYSVRCSSTHCSARATAFSPSATLYSITVRNSFGLRWDGLRIGFRSQPDKMRISSANASPCLRPGVPSPCVRNLPHGPPPCPTLGANERTSGPPGSL